MRRRDVLLIGGAMAVAIAIPPILRRIPSQFEFEPLPGFDGFRRLSGGALSGGIDPFFGLSDTPADHTETPVSEPLSPCQALFGSQGWGEDLPIALFTDFNCPYCKVLESRLMDMRDDGAAIRLIWHDMPLLGDASARAARAVIAARFLGAEDAARRALSRRHLRPGPQALKDLAVSLDLEPDAFLRTYESSRVTQTLASGIALGRRLGLPGTPGTVIGRTLVIGQISDADLQALIQLEREEPRGLCA